MRIGLLGAGLIISFVLSLKFIKEAFEYDGIPFNPVRERKLWIGMVLMAVAVFAFALLSKGVITS